MVGIKSESSKKLERSRGVQGPPNDLIRSRSQRGDDELSPDRSAPEWQRPVVSFGPCDSLSTTNSPPPIFTATVVVPMTLVLPSSSYCERIDDDYLGVWDQMPCYGIQ